MNRDTTADWVGDFPAQRQQASGPSAASTGERPQRGLPHRPDERDDLRARLRALLGRCPAKVASGSVNLTLDWKRVHAEASKVCNTARSSGQQLRTAISSLERFD